LLSSAYGLGLGLGSGLGYPNNQETLDNPKTYPRQSKTTETFNNKPRISKKNQPRPFKRIEDNTKAKTP
jgi:hypothetical protein